MHPLPNQRLIAAYTTVALHDYSGITETFSVPTEPPLIFKIKPTWKLNVQYETKFSFPFLSPDFARVIGQADEAFFNRDHG